MIGMTKNRNKLQRTMIAFAIYTTSAAAGLIATVGLWNCMAVTKQWFYIRNSITTIEAIDPTLPGFIDLFYTIIPVLAAIAILALCSKKLFWKATAVFIISLIFFSTLPFLLSTYFDSRIGKSPNLRTYDNINQIKAVINFHVVPVRLSYFNVPFRLPDNGFKKRDSVIERNSNILGSDWDEFVKVQRRLYGDNPASMMNLATGYETGKDYIKWWNCYPAKTHRDKRSKAIRSVAAGNFVYIPVGPGDDTMAYDMLPYDSSDETVHAAIIYAFGSTNFNGEDVWTPTGDPNKPVTLKPDGIPDGVLFNTTVEVWP